MLKIGLTGGIGSGKSTVAKVFEILGIPVYYADDAAKRLMNTDAELKQEIIRHFGDRSYTGGQLDRSYIAQTVFENKENLQLLNSLVHPVTKSDAEKWMDRQTAPYAIKEAALIFESGVQDSLDFVIGVSAPPSLRISRTMKRDGISREEVLVRMKNQLEEEIKMGLCDFVIYNDEQHAVLNQVLELHQKLLLLPNKK
jgi:dephospho-CoA kinase